jgi:hypothetical protein
MRFLSETHNGMFRSILVTLLLGLAAPAFGQNPSFKFPEFNGNGPYYEIRTSKKTHRYFVIPPGPCSCGGGEPEIVCSKNLKKDLSEQLAIKKTLEAKGCLPNAGCTLGSPAIFADCPAKIKRAKK